MKLVVGLGNPGAEHARQRHNIGFLAADAIASAHGFGPWRAKFHGQIAEGRLGPERVLLLKPGTWMNLSGDSVRAALAFYKLEPGDAVVFHDELDLPPGKVRVKTGGGTAGHNGLRSLDAHIGPDFVRVRLGIGHPGDKRRVTGHVLGDFAKADADWVEDLLAGVADGAPALAAGDTQGFLAAIARRLPPPEPTRPQPVEPPRPRRAPGYPEPAAEARGPLPVNVREAFRAQARHCEDMGSPFTARVCRLLADRLAPGDPVSDRVLKWPGDPGHRADALPLRLAGALHGLVIDGDPALAAAYPPHAPSDDALWTAVAGAFAARAPGILARLDGPPQTNEPQRSAALAPGFLTVAALTGLPLAISELGASAGLNLCWDRFAYQLGAATWGDPASPVRIAPEWRGQPPPLPVAEVAERAGCDRAPVDLTRPEDRLRLMSFVWADQSARMIRVAAAIDLARGVGIRVDRADAADWLADRLAAPKPGRAHVVYHSIVWQYLAPETQARARASLDVAGVRATRAAPLAWLRMEGDGTEPGAAITLTLWPDGETRPLGRADFHGAWVTWRGWPPA